MNEVGYEYGNIPEPTGITQTSTLIFNKINGEFLAVVGIPKDQVNQDDPYCIYIEVDNFNVTTETVEGKLNINEDGTYTEDYKIVKFEDQQEVVTEKHLDNHVAYKITERYPVVEQVNILARAIKILAKNNNIDLEELDEYLDYVNLVKQTNKLHKEFYANAEGIKYVSNEEMLEESIRKFEGGLHEVIGPRAISGGTVF